MFYTVDSCPYWRRKHHTKDGNIKVWKKVSEGFRKDGKYGLQKNAGMEQWFERNDSRSNNPENLFVDLKLYESVKVIEKFTDFRNSISYHEICAKRQ